jgi:hypothetical protein
LEHIIDVLIRIEYFLFAEPHHSEKLLDSYDRMERPVFFGDFLPDRVIFEHIMGDRIAEKLLQKGLVPTKDLQNRIHVADLSLVLKANAKAGFLVLAHTHGYGHGHGIDQILVSAGLIHRKTRDQTFLIRFLSVYSVHPSHEGAFAPLLFFFIINLTVRLRLEVRMILDLPLFFFNPR